MSLNNPAAIGYSASFVVYAALIWRLTGQSATRLLTRALWVACAAMALWGAVLAFHSLGRLSSPSILIITERLPSTSVQAIARIVNSPAGIFWVIDEDSGRYTPIGAWQHPLPLTKTFGTDSSLVQFMRQRQWVIDLTEKQRHPSRYGDLELDSWFEAPEKWWIIVPMLLGNELYGFIALQRAPTLSTLNFEDHDLLRTVGRHVATHLKHAESDRQLSEAQQFSTNHRLSAFLMHDLNNLAAQLALVVKNAEKHRRDPKFIDDMIATVADSGCGMSEVLINERLFRPFDSTKGSQSMGIGAYQAREYIRSIGGQVDVASAPGTGTTFTLQMPVAR